MFVCLLNIFSSIIHFMFISSVSTAFEIETLQEALPLPTIFSLQLVRLFSIQTAAMQLQTAPPCARQRGRLRWPPSPRPPTPPQAPRWAGGAAWPTWPPPSAPGRTTWVTLTPPARPRQRRPTRASPRRRPKMPRWPQGALWLRAARPPAPAPIRSDHPAFVFQLDTSVPLFLCNCSIFMVQLGPFASLFPNEGMSHTSDLPSVTFVHYTSPKLALPPSK